MNQTYSRENISIKQWAEEDRPREKLLGKGKSVLSNAELIAILFGSGSRDMSAVDLAKTVLAKADNDLNQLAKFTVKDLIKFKGIGTAKAVALVSALELGRRRQPDSPSKKIIISSSKDAYECMKPDLLDLGVEEFWMILLKRNNQVIRKVRISAGGVSGTVVDPKVLFKEALEDLASAIILVHNHPSGNMTPSQADIQLTRKIKEAGNLLEIAILDHIIFGNASYYSFADESML
jgi:DNA repair protein RadC